MAFQYLPRVKHKIKSKETCAIIKNIPTLLCYAGHSIPLSNWFAAAAQHGEPDCCLGGESKGKKG